MKIIGLTGHPASGKDTVANYLASKGFVVLSGGNMLRDELTKQGITPDRAAIQEYVTRMREVHGDDYIPKQMIAQIAGDTVISAFREKAGVDLFRKRFGPEFIVLAVDAPLELRYARAQSRARVGDVISFEQFKAEEDRERDSKGFDMDALLKSADIIICNDGTEEELVQRVEQCMQQYKWMQCAAITATKALCTRAKCGTVIVKDEEVIGEGYNAPALDSEEYRMCSAEMTPGKPKYDKTCCVHAEWRAIMDALKRNSEKIIGSTLYFTRVDATGAIKKSGEPFCTVCSRLALDAGIKTFVLWQEAGIHEYPTDEYNRVSYQYVP